MIRKTDPDTIAPYLKDASNYSGGSASEVVIPETRDELTDFLKTNSQPVTVAGAGTGLTASRIPHSGVILSMERFRQVGELEEGSIEVGAAVTLQDLQSHLQTTPYFYPPNPTEALASIGGTLATNASGSRSYKYGVTRDFVLEAEVVLASGQSLSLARGLTIEEPLILEDGSRISFPRIAYQSPRCKNAAGYFVRPGMDWLDLFIGSDGTLGIIIQARLKLLPRPEDFISGILFFDAEEDCWSLVETLRSQRGGTLDPCSLEYFDRFSLQRLRQKFQRIPDRAQAALFFEQDVSSKPDYDVLLEAWYEFLSQHTVLLDDSWFSQSPKDLRSFHEFRHQIPVMLNEENSRLGRIKIGTDMAVENEKLFQMMRFYRETLTQGGLDYVIFGHIGDNHLHINLLPTQDKVEPAHRIYQRLVDQILKWGGTVSAEHGIGKLKKDYFSKMVGPTALGELKEIKKTLDPGLVLGLGNCLDF